MKIKEVGLLKGRMFEENKLLETLKSSGIACCSSDLARIMGVDYEEGTGYGNYWLDVQPQQDKKKVALKSVSKIGSIIQTYSTATTSGVRISIPFKSIDGFNLEDIDNLSVEYPMFAISGGVGKTIKRLFEQKSKLLFKTGRIFDIDNKEYEEYTAFGIKFIKFPNKRTRTMLSDGTYAEPLKDVYLKVENIPFIVDLKEEIIYSSLILLALPFDSKNNGSQYKDSELYSYLNDKFLKSINDELEHKEITQLFNEELKVSNNRYHFNFRNLSEEEIIEICINSNIAVFLHGKTGTGKTERMVALDRNLELIDFGCTSSDGFTGIVAKDFNSKELFLYEPYWYKNLCEKCKKEPDLIHILFLEELTNAKSDVQKVAFEVTLNKTLTNSGFRLKLPENAVVCAAGNEANQSKSANAMSEPLFGRFAHVYIDTDSNNWLKWALKRKKEGKVLKYQKVEKHDRIHPAIIDYIRVHGDKVLRTEYNGITPNADPRKWAMASKALYQCNNPKVLRSFVGKEITDDFVKFCQMNLISVEDVLSNRYSPSDVSLDPSIRLYTVMCLTTVDEENVDKVREFVLGLGKEYLATFDYEWSKDNDERIMKLYHESQKSLVKRTG